MTIPRCIGPSSKQFQPSFLQLSINETCRLHVLLTATHDNTHPALTHPAMLPASARTLQSAGSQVYSSRRPHGSLCIGRWSPRAFSSAQQQRPLAAQCPPTEYDYKAEILPETLETVKNGYPELLPLVLQGNLVVYKRPANYKERRSDGYTEPQLIFILGTAHVSQQSAAEVEQLITAVKPQSVVVELCKSRVGVLHMPEGTSQRSTTLQQQLDQHSTLEVTTASPSSSNAAQQYWQRRNAAVVRLKQQTDNAKVGSSSSPGTDTPDSNSSSSSSSRQPAQAKGHSSMYSSKAANPMSLSGSNFLSAVTRSAQLGGQSGLLLRLLLAGQAQKAADRLGVQPGLEFRAAARAADALGASLVLGDRPIEITLERAWTALNWRRRLQLLIDLLTASGVTAAHEDVTHETIEQLRSSDDAISAFTKSLSKAYPELIGPLIAERDLYLAWSMKRSKAVNGTHAVVGVVGKGHLRGIVYAMKHDNGALRFSDLVGGKNKKKSSGEQTAALIRRLLLEGFIGAGVYAAWLALSTNNQ